MALERIGWQNGTLVTPAQVLDDGTVQPAVYEGTTKLSASNLAQMEDNTENFVNEVKEEILNTSRLIKLWENSDVSSSFSSQTITLSSDDYDYLIWIFDYYRSGNMVVSFISIKGQGLYPNYAGDYGVSGTYYVSSYLRTVTYNSDTSFEIGTCYCRYGNNTGRYTENGRLIPVAIYGGKF